MRLESNQQCREAGDLQSPGVTSFPTHPYFGSPSTDRTYDIFVNSEAQLPLCYRGIDWLQRQDSHLRSPAYETGGDDWTPLLRDNIYRNVTIEKHTQVRGTEGTIPAMAFDQA